MVGESPAVWRHFKAIALDFDGTLSEHGADIAAPVREALAAVRASGMHVIVVTGRILAELLAVVPDAGDICDAVVAENGGTLLFHGRERLLAEPVSVELAGRLRRRAIPVRVGRVLLACHAGDAGTALEEIEALGLDYQLVRNRSELMIVPAGVSKGAGLLAALGRLGISRHSTIAVGDAENDLSLLSAVETGVAVANAVPPLRDHADIVLSGADGAGVLELIGSGVAAGDLRMPPRRWRITLGLDAAGAPVSVPASQSNMLIAGESGAGKSYLAGLVGEQLIDMGYSVLVVDPEGDHVALAESNGTLLTGGHEELASPAQVVRFLTHRFGSVVLNLSMTERTTALEYLRALRTAVDESRARSGLPHWILVDEAHWLSERQGIVGHLFDGTSTGYCLATYRPEDLETAAAGAIDTVIGVHGADPQFDDRVAALAGAVLGLDQASTLASLGGVAYGGIVVATRAGVQTVSHVARRTTRHVRHWHKYANVALPLERSFHFCRDVGVVTGTVSTNVTEFYHDVGAADGTTLLHHTRRHDFSRWLGGVIGNRALAAAVAVIESRSSDPLVDVDGLRASVLQVIAQTYGSP